MNRPQDLKRFITIFILLMIFSTTIQAAPRLAYAIRTVYAKNNADKKMSTYITQELYRYMVELKEFDVWGPDRIKEILEENDIVDIDINCSEEACDVVLGQVISADKMLSGSLVRKSNGYKLSVELKNIAKDGLSEAFPFMLFKNEADFDKKVKAFVSNNFSKRLLSNRNNIVSGKLDFILTRSNVLLFVNGKFNQRLRDARKYSLSFPVGKYSIEFRKKGFMSITESNKNILKDKTISLGEITFDRTKNIKTNIVKKYGSISLVTEPSGAVIFIDNTHKDFNGKPFGLTNGVLHNIPVGKHIITLERDGYYPLELTADIKEEGDYADVPNIISLVSRYGYLSVYTSPTNAIFYLDGVEISKKDSIKKPAGEYEISAVARDYHKFTKKILIPDSNKVLIESINLKVNFGNLSLNVSLADAKVFLDGTFIGNTDKNGSLSAKRIPSGVHTLIVKSNFYMEKQKEILIEDNKTFKISLNLNPNFAELRFNNTNKNMKVFLDSVQVLGINKKNTLKISPGYHSIYATIGKRYKKYDTSFVVKIGDIVKINSKFPKKYGKIVVAPLNQNGGVQSGCDIYINNKLISKKTPCTLPNLWVGKYNIVVNLDNMYMVSKTIYVKENKITRLEETLKLVHQDSRDALIYLGFKGGSFPEMLNQFFVISGQSKVTLFDDNTKNDIKNVLNHVKNIEKVHSVKKKILWVLSTISFGIGTNYLIKSNSDYNNYFKNRDLDNMKPLYDTYNENLNNSLVSFSVSGSLLSWGLFKKIISVNRRKEVEIYFENRREF